MARKTAEEKARDKEIARLQREEMERNRENKAALKRKRKELLKERKRQEQILERRAKKKDISEEEKLEIEKKQEEERETILMMADAVEARSRTLGEYTEKSITDMVENMIDAQIADGQFKDAPISFKDVETVKKVLADKI